MSDAARFVQQAKKERFEEEIIRAAEPRTLQGSSCRRTGVTDALQLDEQATKERSQRCLEEETNRTAAPRTFQCLPTRLVKNLGVGRCNRGLTSRAQLEGSRRRGDERTHNQMVTEATKAIATLVRYGPAQHIWFDKLSMKSKINTRSSHGALVRYLLAEQT